MPLAKRKVQGRGKQSQAKYRQARRAERRKLHQEDPGVRRNQLLLRSIKSGQTVVLTSFDILRDGRASQSGWQGAEPPEYRRKQIRSRYKSGRIKEDLSRFLPLPYISKSSTLTNKSTQKKCKKGVRGQHFPCILGHYRQSAKVAAPCLTGWHNKHIEDAEFFLQEELVIRLNKFVSSVLCMAFPGVHKRFQECAAWHQKRFHIKARFGSFFNMCINGIFPGHKRVHCLPHSDSKNPISVCALMVYLKPGSKFNHTQRSWLVIWEAGVIIELPPWVLLIYPSSLFFHFNVDISGVFLFSSSFFFS
ncbi:hypothetical protein DENSPDRAFT_780695 [Dentipellis sp. KUC8613]|nr:hypothetical protein DENSPDRAFT_780695 [Dentipellis sp. KUC8613]